MSERTPFLSNDEQEFNTSLHSLYFLGASGGGEHVLVVDGYRFEAEVGFCDLCSCFGNACDGQIT